MKRNTLLHLLSLPLLLLLTLPAYSTHFVGAEISYQQLPTNPAYPGAAIYRIFVKVFYDCAGGATTPLPGPAPDPFVVFTSPNSSVQPIAMQPNWTALYFEEIPLACPSQPTRCVSSSAPINGMSEAVHYRDYAFSAPPGTVYIAEWSNCCRNSTITSGSQDEAIYVSAKITLGLNNSAPIFTQQPETYILAGLPFTANCAAWDPDGDSLSYQLVSCMQTATAPCTYNPGYSPTSPLGYTWLTSINYATGALMFTPNPVGATITAPVCIRVNEYRNGQLIGYTTRDYQVYVLNTSVGWPGAAPAVGGITNVTGGILTAANEITTLAGDTVGFDLTITDADATDMLASAYQQVFTGGKVTITPVGSSTNPLTVHVSAIAASAPQARQHLGIAFRDDHCVIPKAAAFPVFLKVASSLLQVSGTATPTPCDSIQGAIDLTANTLTPPMQFLWSTGDTTEDLSGLASGVYSVLVTDAAGNSFVDSFYVESLDMSLAVTQSWDNCLPDAGILTATTTGGTAPVRFAWQTGDTTSAISGLAAGIYQVVATDSMGCLRQQTLLLEKPDSCMAIIKGRVYVDWNLNCQQDTFDTGLPYHYVDITPGNGAFTDMQGFYEVEADMGTFSLYANSPYTTPLCANDTVFKTIVARGVDSTGNDFPKQDPSVSAPYDLALWGYTNPARPGFHRSTWLDITNLSGVATGGTLVWQHDSIFQFLNAIPSPSSYDPLTHTAVWNSIGTLNFWQNTQFQITVQVPATTPLGLAYSDTAWIMPSPTDTVTVNNAWTVHDTTTGSFDPNDKAVSPKGASAEGYIRSTDSVLTYTIRFQNTGTDTAFFVTLRDTLDTDLDLKGFKHLTSSFPYTLRAEGDNILVFRFDHINLPDSGRDEAGSHGFVSFSLPMKTVAQGMVVENRAAIYFDFNAPVITNTVKNTVCDPVSGAFSATRLPGGGWQFTPTMVLASSWHWDFGVLGSSTDATPAPLHLPDTGYYPVTLTVSNMCSDTSVTLTLHEAWAIGIDPSNSLEISIQPNPAKAQARIRITAAQVQTVTVTDAAGRTVQTLPVVNGEATFVRGDLPAGMYYVRAVAEDGRNVGIRMMVE